jgi:hypothetical protein
MRKLFPLTILMSMYLIATPASGSDISNYFTPYGFRTPLLEQGQYVLSFNPHYDRQESRQDPTWGSLVHSESIWKQYFFSLDVMYARTDRLVYQGSLVIYPGQRRSTYRDVFNQPYEGYEAEIGEHSNFTVSPAVQVSFRPQTNMQFYGDLRYSREKWYWEIGDGERFSGSKSENLHFDLGFTMLGRVSPERSGEAFGPQIFNFLRPYGFRTPLLSQSQYAVNLGCQYTRSEFSPAEIVDPGVDNSIWRRYQFSLNGLYAPTEKLLFQGSLDVYPAQTRETYDINAVAGRLNYDEMRSDFAVFPGLVASVRPKLNMEFCGSFLFTRENLHKIRESGFQSDVSQDYYHFDFGYTILLKGSRHASGPIPESEFSNFFVPHGFKMPLLKQGQGALNAQFHHDRTESEEHHPRSLQAIDTRSTMKRYYFSLNGVYAVIDQLMVECGLDVLPGQSRVTDRLKWYSDVSGSPTETTEKQRSHFAVSPRLEVSFRPLTSVEFCWAFYFNKEKSYMENQLGGRTSNLRNEYLYLDFGLTVLGVPW